MNRVKSLKILTSTILMLMISCKLGEDYQRQELPRVDDYRNGRIDGESIANTAWWNLFEDSALTRLIETCLENNLDLNKAMARMNEARAAIDIVRSDLYPRINYSATATSSFNTESTGAENQVFAGAGISYQVDLWGRYRRLSEAALQDYLATEEGYRSLTIALVSQVAQAYMILRDLDNRLLIAEQTSKTWQENLNIVEARHKGGFVSEVDVNQSKIQLNEGETAVQNFIRLRTQTENALSILLGLPPQDIRRGKILFDQSLPFEVPTGLPSELLDRRPDVLLAERKLMAQTARYGASEALKYPSLTLSADMGYQFTDPSFGLANLGADVLGPIFNNKANKRRI
ncbi:MAG TPA: hypothetical protein DCX54_07445 [Flavobacteriales bacterium]|nr:hypothetical protein [Flavobacteriales bacterium]